MIEYMETTTSKTFENKLAELIRTKKAILSIIINNQKKNSEGSNNIDVLLMEIVGDIY